MHTLLKRNAKILCTYVIFLSNEKPQNPEIGANHCREPLHLVMGKFKVLVRVNQELIPKVLDIEATSERVVSSSKAYHELIISYSWEHCKYGFLIL